MNRLLRKVFFPSPESSRFRRYIPWITVIGVPLVVLLVIPATWEYTNSPSFCGETCHTMPPEYQTYLVSPHARVPCVDCHIGRGTVYEKFVRKTGHTQLLFDTLTNNYEYPIFVSEMRPARESCELCHFPEKFSDDSLRAIQRYRNDEENSAYTLYLLMHTGGGSIREGLGQGIHWHVENKVEYVALDKLEQEIPWVRVTRADGTVQIYSTEESPVTTDTLSDYTLHEMDCITCHNRISHLIMPPQNAVDAALSRGDISTDIPYIREKATELLSEEYASITEAHDMLVALPAFYEENYPDFYQSNQSEVDNAAQTLVQIYENNNYPEQELNWETHPNNVGHRDWPGCFRCHDGQHFTETDDAIRLECNLCHSIPTIVYPGDIEPNLPLATGIEPESHLSTTWITRHHNEFDATCANCHTVENAGGTSDTSFCSNSGCHGSSWTFAGFDAPALRIDLGIEEPTAEPTFSAEEMGGPITYKTLQPFFEQTCGACHGASPSKGLRLTDYASIMAGSSEGPVIVPGEPENSRIIETLTNGHFAQVTPQQLEMITAWIAQGAEEGEGGTAPEATEPAPQEEEPAPQPPSEDEEEAESQPEPEAQPEESAGTDAGAEATPESSEIQSYWESLNPTQTPETSTGSYWES